MAATQMNLQGIMLSKKKKKNPITNVYILYNSIYITLLKRQNFGNEQITDQGLVMVIKDPCDGAILILVLVVDI